MVMPTNPTEFPKFPSLYTPEDVQRKRELEEQRRQIEEVYQTKFTKEAQAKMPLPERVLRTTISGTPLATIAKAVAPWQWGFDYGMLPEEARKEKEDVLFELADLSRREQVATFVPTIQNTLRALALTEKSLLTDPKDLTSYFHLNELGFNEEEIQWVAEYAHRVATASPEDILTGKGLDIGSVTEREMDLLKKSPRKDPRFIFSSIAFSKNLEAVQNALREAYPSQVEEELSYRDRVIGEYAKFYEDVTGKKPSGDISKDTAAEVFAKIAKDTGKPLILTDDRTGSIFAGKVKPDSSVFVPDQVTGEDHLVGSYDSKTGRIIPLSPITGEPMTDEPARESAAKNLWDALYLGTVEAIQQTKQAILGVIPRAFIPAFTDKYEDRPPMQQAWSEEYWEAQKKRRQETILTVQDAMDIRTAEHEEWLKTHPELKPKPQYNQSPIEHLELLKDPEYWGYTIVSNAPIMGAALVTGVLTGLATGNPVAGAVAGAAIMTPAQIGGVYDDLVANGADPNNAATLATSVGTLMGAVEIIPGMIALKAVSPVFMRVFRKELQTELTRGLVKQMSLKGILATASKIEISETLEEVIQQSMQNAAVKTVNENRSLVEGLSETAIRSAISVLPLAIFGGGSEYLNMKANLSPKVQQEIEEVKSIMRDAGLSEQHAESVAVAQVLETETGQAQVEEAVFKSKDVLPPGERVSYLEGRIAEYNEELEVTNSSINQQQDRLTKMEASGESPTDIAEKTSLIKEMRERLSSIQKDREHYQKELEKVRKEVTKAKESEPSPEIMAPVPPNPEVVGNQIAKRLGIKYDGVQEGVGMQFTDPQTGSTTYGNTIGEVKDKLVSLRRGFVAQEGGIIPEGFLVRGRTGRTGEVKGAFYSDTLSEATRYGEELRFTKRPERVYKLTQKEYLKFKNLAWDEGLTFLEELTLKNNVEAISMPSTLEPSRRLMTGKDMEKPMPNEIWFPVKPKSYTLKEVEALQEPSKAEGEGIIPLETQEAPSEAVEVSEGGLEQLLPIEEEAIREANALTIPKPMDKDAVAEALAGIAKAVPEVLRAIRNLIPDLTMFPGESLPRLPDLEIELANQKVAFSNPIIRTRMRGNFLEEKLHNEARDLLNSLHDMLDSLKDKGEKRKVVGTIKNIARKADVRAKTLLTKRWDGLEPPDQRKLAASLLPNGSLDLDVTRWFKDSKYVFAEMEKKSALPFFTIYQRTRRVHGYILRVKDEYLKRIKNNPLFKDIVRDVKLQERVSQLINSKDPNSGVMEPDNITDSERLCAFEISRILDEWKPIVRFLRFTEAFEESGTVEHIQGEIKDASEEDITEALKIYTTQGENALWSYLGNKSWGVLDTGYDPRRVFDPSLKVKEPPSSTTRGARHLMSRQFLEAPAGQEKGLFRRFDTYNGSMAIRWFMRKEITALDEYFRASASKWADPEAIKNYLTGYIKEIQGFPQESNIFTWMVREVQKVVYPVIFMRPVLGFRNVLQPLWSFPYRKELFSSLLTGLRKDISPSLTRMGKVYFATAVDQSGRPMREFLFQDSESSFPGKLPTWLKVGVFLPKYAIAKPLGLLSNLTARIPTMSISDKASRSWAFWTMLRRSSRANDQYLPGDDMSKWDLDKWIANSGMRELTFEQQNYILGLLGQTGEISWAVSGLQHLSGKEAAALQIATDVVEKTLYMYDRSASSQAHWGESGRAYGSLLIFPRSTVQMFALEIGKVFNEESSPIERIAATKNIILLYLAGEMLSRFLVLVTGRERKDYSLVNMFTWELGGLSYGIARDVSTLVSDLAIASFGSSEERTLVWDKLPTELTRLGDTGVGFYSIALDAIETVLDEEKGLDKRWIRKVRAWFDAQYKPEDVEKAELTVIQKFQKILAGANPPELDTFQNSQRELIRVEDKLGERELNGLIYTTKQLSGDIRKALNEVDPSLVSEENGFTDLVLFHEEAYDAKKLYDALPSEPSKIRENWRKERLEEEAMFLFWGWTGKSVFVEGTKEGKEVMKLLNFWWETLGISREMRPDATWVDLKSIPVPPLTTAEK